jgi:hypothetical protein
MLASMPGEESSPGPPPLPLYQPNVTAWPSCPVTGFDREPQEDRQSQAVKAIAYGTGSGKGYGLSGSYRIGRVGTVTIHIVLDIFAWIQVLQKILSTGSRRRPADG